MNVWPGNLNYLLLAGVLGSHGCVFVPTSVCFALRVHVQLGQALMKFAVRFLARVALVAAALGDALTARALTIARRVSAPTMTLPRVRRHPGLPATAEGDG
jgi:hypothetical protein